jgi:hypothetical protein
LPKKRQNTILLVGSDSFDFDLHFRNFREGFRKGELLGWDEKFSDSGHPTHQWSVALFDVSNPERSWCGNRVNSVSLTVGQITDRNDISTATVTAGTDITSERCSTRSTGVSPLIGVSWIGFVLVDPIVAHRSGSLLPILEKTPCELGVLLRSRRRFENASAEYMTL